MFSKKRRFKVIQVSKAFRIRLLQYIFKETDNIAIYQLTIVLKSFSKPWKLHLLSIPFVAVIWPTKTDFQSKIEFLLHKSKNLIKLILYRMEI